MMRYLLLFLLLLLLSLPTLAQDDFAMPDLPDEPIFVSTTEEVVQWAEPYQFAWLDNQTLVFTFANLLVPYYESNGYSAYAYFLDPGSLTELYSSPFIINWNPEIQDYFQAGDYLIHRSPYPNENGTVPILYNSNLPDFGAAILYGQYWIDGENYGNPQYPLSIPPIWGFDVHWSRNNNAILLERGNEYSPDVSLSYVNLSTGNLMSLPFYLVDWDYDHAFGFSPDGTRIALATDGFFTGDMDYSPEWWQKLIIWDAPRHDDACACTYDPVAHVIYSEVDNGGKNFAGVGFVDEDTILYIGNEGLFRYTISTEESVLLNPEFNTHWINLAIFRPIIAMWL